MTRFSSGQDDAPDNGPPVHVILDDESTVEVPACELDRLRECCTLIEIIHWEPRRKIHWCRKPLTTEDRQALIRVGGFLGAVFGAVLGVPILSLVGIPDIPTYGAVIIGAVAGPIVILAAMFIMLPYAYPALDVEVDFYGGVIRWRVGCKKGETQAAEMAQLVLRGILEHYTPEMHQGSSRLDVGRPAYRCAIDLVNDRGKTLRLIESERSHKGSREKAVRDLAPLVLEVAQGLDVPWSFEGFSGKKRTFFERLFAGGMR